LSLGSKTICWSSLVFIPWKKVWSVV